MKIAKNTVVSVHYTSSDAQGNLIKESKEPMTYLDEDYEDILQKIDEAPESNEPGYETALQVEMEDALGDHEAELAKKRMKRDSTSSRPSKAKKT